jgi:conjugative transfer signal peptidase TraF
MTMSPARRMGVLIGICMMVGGYSALAGAPLRINLTASLPRGVYRTVAVVGPLAIGDLVYFCAPPGSAWELAAARHYTPPGPCPGGSAPFLKPVVALSGDPYSVATASVAILGQTLPLASFDSAGRSLPHLPLGVAVVPANAVMVASDKRNGFDSRYAGPLPISAIVGRAFPVLTE